MQKTYRIANGPLTINNVPPQRYELDDSGNTRFIPAGSVWFNAAGEYTTDDPEQQAALEGHPEVRVVP